MPTPAKDIVIDGFVSLEGGVNSGVIPLLVEKNQLAFAVNATVRGSFVSNRGGYLKCPLSFESDAVAENRFKSGRFQGAGIYSDNAGKTSLVASISGRLFQLFPDRVSTYTRDVSISYQTLIDQDFVVPERNLTVTIVVQSTANLGPNYEILINGKNYVVSQVLSATSLIVTNIDDIPGTVVGTGRVLLFWDLNPSNRTQSWLFQAEQWMIVNDGQSVPIFFNGAFSRRSQIVGSKPELPAGRMGAYGWGRVWMSGTDGRTYFAGDLVGSQSGTNALQKRDAVLKFTENAYLVGGGRFIVPGNIGNIQGMAFVAILDQSLGQGPLQVFTPQQIFSCATPVDRTQWAAVENPIQTISQITSGATSQWSISPVNGDMFYRGRDGWRSLILGRREFATWGNTPNSREMNRILVQDEQSLLPWASSCVFDNRLLMTCSPAFSARGVYHRGLIALDFDVISSMQQKAPPVYDGLWTGLQVLQILSGTFDGVDRCFAFVLTGLGEIELWEVLTRQEAYQDNGNIPIIWSFETGTLFKDGDKGGIFKEKKLVDGELFVDDVRGRVDFQVFYRPDQISCWTEWHRWSICAKDRSCGEQLDTGCVAMSEFQPQSWPRMGFGTPDSTICNPASEKPYCYGNTFQIKVQVQGSCRIIGMNVSAALAPEQAMAPMICERSECFVETIGEPQQTYENTEQTYTATCPDGQTGDPVTVTIPAGAVLSYVSVEAANAIALSAAQAQAEKSLICT